MNKEEKTYKNPIELKFSITDYLKVLFSWLRAFKTTFNIEPGLYYTGSKYEIEAPLLVTCNYHMTVFVLWRILRKRNTRILVIDTKGINVWCSSGKGKFSAGNIIKHLRAYKKEILSTSEQIELILPKLALSGVSLARLKQNKINPKIGPIYASELPTYLEDIPLKDRTNDKFRFSIKDRLFTLPPTIVQFSKYLIYMTAVLYLWNYFFYTGIYWQVIPFGIVFNVLYVILFPFLPSKKFSLKGLFLFIPFYMLITYLRFSELNYISDNWTYLFYSAFTAATAIFFSLYYTGSSGVSNYSLVKKEIIQLLPVTIVLYLISIVAIIVLGV